MESDSSAVDIGWWPAADTSMTASRRCPSRVSIRPGAQDLLLRDVFPLSSFELAGFRWTMDETCHLMQPIAGVTTLVTSPEVERTYHSGDVAVTFRWDGAPVLEGGRPTTGPEMPVGGAVLHVISHFDLQQDASLDKFALQQLLLNFILEKQRENSLREAAAERKTR